MFSVLSTWYRNALAPQRVEPLGALEAREDQPAEHAGSGRSGASHPLPHEAVHERDESQAQADGVDEQDLFDRPLTSQRLVFGRREQMGQPVVAQLIAPVEGILRRKVSLAQLRGDGHPPHEVRGEVRAVGAAVLDRRRHLRKRPADDAERHDQQQEHRNDVGVAERGRGQRVAQHQPDQPGDGGGE